MTRIRNEICIDGSIDTVFDLVTTTRHWPRWHPATEGVSGVTDRPLALGDRVHERAVIGGRTHSGTWTVTEHERPVRMLLQVDGGRIEIAYSFRSVDAKGTLLQRQLDYRPADFAGGASDPAILEERMFAQSAEALRRLKWLVEQLIPLERNKRTVRRVLEQAFNEGNLDAVDAGFAPDAVIHDPGTEFRGPSQLRAGLGTLLAAFPDFHFTPLDEVAEGDRVVLRYRGQGTHRGEFLGIPASGRRIDYTGLILVRVADDRIAEFWAQPDQLGLLKQLGARIEA